MFKRWLTLGSAAGLLLAAGALAGCGQNNQASEQDFQRESHGTQVNTAKVEKGAERASRELSAGATALVQGVKKGVKEGTAEAQRKSGDGNQADNTTTTTTTTERSSGPSNE